MEPNKKNEYAGIDIRQLIEILLQKIWVILFSAVVVGLLFMIYTKQTTVPTYTSSTKLYVLNKEDSTSTSTANFSYAEEKTIGGIIIPDTAKEKPLKGEVVAVGNGTKDEEMVLKVGDNVLYGKYAGTELEVDGNKYLIMRQSDVLAVLA
jgi:chaperonin GroES